MYPRGQSWELILFLIFINDIRIISSLHFACSQTIVSRIGTFIQMQDCLILQEDLDSLGALLTQTNHSWLHSASANFGKHSVGKISGITIAENMDWGKHISDNSSKATESSGFLHTHRNAPTHIVKLRFKKWRRYRGRQSARPAGCGTTLLVLDRCSISCNGQLWRRSILSAFLPQDSLGDYVYW